MTIESFISIMLVLAGVGIFLVVLTLKKMIDAYSEWYKEHGDLIRPPKH